MAITTGSLTLYDKAIGKLCGGVSIDLSSPTVYAALLDSTYTPDFVSHEFESDVVSYEESSAGYARVLLTNTTLTEDSPGVWAFRSDDVMFLNPTNAMTCMYFVLIDTTSGVATTNPIIGVGYLDSANGGQEVTVTAGTSITLYVNINGWVNFSKV